MKRILTLILFMVTTVVLWADVVEIDGIKYNLISKGKVAEVTKKTIKYAGNITIPATVEYENVTYSVTSIGDGAFYGCSGLTSISIPNSVTSIGKNAFYGCSGLTSIMIPEGVTSIGNSVFRYCSGLTSITIPNGVTSIGHSVFDGCSGLTSVTIPNSVTSIGDLAFFDCSGLTSITIPNGVTSIGSGAFFDCSGLTSVQISDLEAWCKITFANDDSNPLYYAHHLYVNDEEIKDLVIPNSVTSIGRSAFYYCSGLASVTIPNSVTSIGESAFEYCSGLTSVTIPSSVTSIGESAFEYCSGLTSVTIDRGIRKIQPLTFFNCNSLISISIPNSVTSIENHVFSGCRSLTSVIIPNSVTSIGYSVFSDCSSLTSVSLGSGIRAIRSQAFLNCSGLADVYCYSESVPETSSNAFEGSYIKYTTLHVPDASLENYKNTEPWSGFGVIEGFSGGGGGTEIPKCATPTISYQNGKLSFMCATEGAEFITDITDIDIKKHYDATISLTATYNISVYAIMSGYDKSDVATATLCWIDKDPQIEGINNGVAKLSATPVLIQSNGGVLTIQGANDGTRMSIYDTAGQIAGSAVSSRGHATVFTNLESGTIAIVKIGEKSVKVVVK